MILEIILPINQYKDLGGFDLKIFEEIFSEKIPVFYAFF